MENLKKDKILILSSTFGDGHKQVAKAISEVIEYSLPNTEPIIIDIMEWLHPYLYPVSHYLYKKGIKQFPNVYRFLYKRTRVRNTFSTKLNSLFLLGKFSILEVINQLNPLVVVSTFPFAAGMISKLKEQNLISVPAVTIITDYTDHSYWISPYTDQYLVGSMQVRDRLILQGVEESKIRYTGIPVRQCFLKDQSKERLFKKYAVDSNKFSVLMMGGGEGLIGKGLSTFKALELLSESIQLIIVCGRNQKLKKQLEFELKDSKHNVLLLGYCENIQELMAISDLMISKPGGVTTSEALAMELPLLIYNPLPGQEEDNANYLLQLGIAYLAESEKELVTSLESILNNTSALTFKKQKTKYYKAKNPSLEAVDAMVKMINGSKGVEYVKLSGTS